MIPADLHADCISLARRIAPCMMAAPLYLLDSADVPAVRTDGIFGAFIEHIDANLRDCLVSRGEWRGSGRLIVLNISALQENYFDAVARGAKQTFIHELAHAVRAQPSEPTAVDEEPIIRQIAAERFERFRADPAVVSGDIDHGAPFVRRCLHLWQRSIWAGFYFESWMICGGQRYAMSDPREYLERLGDEPYRLAQESFELIEQIPPPLAFAALWSADLVKMEKHHA